MMALVLRKTVTCKLTGEQSHDREIGVCYLDGKDIGETIIEAGFARDCPRFSGGKYRQAEENAKARGDDLSAVYALPPYCK